MASSQKHTYTLKYWYKQSAIPYDSSEKQRLFFTIPHTPLFAAAKSVRWQLAEFAAVAQNQRKEISMYQKLKRLQKENGYNKYLIQSIILTALGAHILGGIALYNCIKLGTSIELYCKNSDKDAYNDILLRSRRISKLLASAYFFVILKYFLIIVTLYGGLAVTNEYLNLRQTLGK